MAKKPDSFYFDNYVACADLAVQAAELLTKIFENFDPAQIHDMLNKMHAIEHAADKKHHELRRRPAHRLYHPARARGSGSDELRARHRARPY